MNDWTWEALNNVRAAMVVGNGIEYGAPGAIHLSPLTNFFFTLISYF